MIVVCDTSPVNYLVLIDGIDLLPQLFTTVVLAESKLVDLEASIRRLLDTNFRASPALIDDILRRS